MINTKQSHNSNANKTEYPAGVPFCMCNLQGNRSLDTGPGVTYLTRPVITRPETGRQQSPENLSHSGIY